LITRKFEEKFGDEEILFPEKKIVQFIVKASGFHAFKKLVEIGVFSTKVLLFARNQYH